MLPPYFLWPRVKRSAMPPFEPDDILLIIIFAVVLGFMFVYLIGQNKNESQNRYEEPCEITYARYVNITGEVERYCIIK